MIAIFFAWSRSTAYWPMPSTAPHVPPLNWKLTGLRTDSKLTGIPPTNGMPLFCRVVMPVPQMSMPPMTASTLSDTICCAQLCDRSGLKLVLHATSSIGRPSTPFISVLRKSMAVRSACGQFRKRARGAGVLVDRADTDRPPGRLGRRRRHQRREHRPLRCARDDRRRLPAGLEPGGSVVRRRPAPGFEPVGSLHAPTATSATTTHRAMRSDATRSDRHLSPSSGRSARGEPVAVEAEGHSLPEVRPAPPLRASARRGPRGRIVGRSGR